MQDSTNSAVRGNAHSDGQTSRVVAQPVRGDAPLDGLHGDEHPEVAIGKTSLHPSPPSSSTVFHANTPVPAARDLRALVIEDVREAAILLRTKGYEVDRLTHAELMSHLGERYAGDLRSMRYSLLRISTPADWYVRAPHKRAGPH